MLISNDGGDQICDCALLFPLSKQRTMSHTFHFLLSTNIISAMQKKHLAQHPGLDQREGY